MSSLSLNLSQEQDSDCLFIKNKVKISVVPIFNEKKYEIHIINFDPMYDIFVIKKFIVNGCDLLQFHDVHQGPEEKIYTIDSGSLEGCCLPKDQIEIFLKKYILDENSKKLDHIDFIPGDEVIFKRYLQ